VLRESGLKTTIMLKKVAFGGLAEDFVTGELAEPAGEVNFITRPAGGDKFTYPSYNLFCSPLVINHEIKRRLLCVEDMVITGIVVGVGIDPGGGVFTAGRAAVCSLRCR
jgi:hypothetical protein